VDGRTAESHTEFVVVDKDTKDSTMVTYKLYQLDNLQVVVVVAVQVALEDMEMHKHHDIVVEKKVL
jgi:hypothetical protein